MGMKDNNSQIVMLKHTSIDHIFSNHTNSTFRFTNRNKFSLIETKGVHVNNDDFCFIRGFFPDKKYINLSSQGYMREESMVIQNTKKNSVI